MREIVDQLIEERAPWLRRRGPLVSMARPILHALLQYDRTIKVGEALEPLPGDRRCCSRSTTCSRSTSR